jgi:hypothetical protein
LSSPEAGDGGIGVSLAAGSMTNNGRVTGGAGGVGFGGQIGRGGDGVDLAGGSLSNRGTITGGTGGGVGVRLSYPSASSQTLTNLGTIIGGTGPASRGGGIGVDLGAGSLTNDGTITGGAGGRSGGIGIYVYATGRLTNDGTIAGGTGGNGMGGIGVSLRDGGTLTNTGFIGGGDHADAVYFGYAASRLILYPGAQFGGSIVAHTNSFFSNVLELAAAGSVGTLAGLGGTITGFGTIQFDPSAVWLIEGNTAGLAAGQTIDGFAFGDTINLQGVTATGSTYSNGILTLDEAGGSTNLIMPGTFATAQFIVTQVVDGTDVSLACFVAGTRIRTSRGEVAVEALRKNDIVLHAGGGTAPIIWIGYRHIDCLQHPRKHDVLPIRVRAGAFGHDQPYRDLMLSPDHAVLANGVLIPIRYLINGRTVAQVSVTDVTYYHVELPAHDVILAEGLPCETYLDTGNRAAFDAPIASCCEAGWRMQCV